MTIRLTSNSTRIPSPRSLCRATEHKENLPPDTKATPFIKFQGEVARELLAEESDEVKAAIEAFRSNPVETLEPTNDEIVS